MKEKAVHLSKSGSSWRMDAFVARSNIALFKLLSNSCREKKSVFSGIVLLCFNLSHS